MKFTLERQPALEALALLGAVSSAKNTIPILNNVHIDAGASGIVAITATDLNMRLTCDVTGQVERNGATTVEASRLLQIVRALPEGSDFTLDVGNDPKASFRAGRSRFALSMLPAQDFPIIAAPPLTHVAELPASAWARLLSLGSQCASRDEKARPYLTATYLHTVGRKLRAVATDGKRMMYGEADAPEGLGAPDGVMLPPRTVDIMERIVSSVPDDTPVVVSFDTGRVTLSTDRLRLVSKVIGGEDAAKYFDYSRIMPKAFCGVISVDTDLLTGAVSRALITADNKENGVVFEVEASRLVVTSRDMLGDNCREEAECEWDGDEPARFTLNGTQVAAILARVRTEVTLLRVPGPDAPPAVVIAETGDGADWYGMTVMFKG